MRKDLAQDTRQLSSHKSAAPRHTACNGLTWAAIRKPCRKSYKLALRTALLMAMLISIPPLSYAAHGPPSGDCAIP